MRHRMVKQHRDNKDQNDAVAFARNAFLWPHRDAPKPTKEQLAEYTDEELEAELGIQAYAWFDETGGKGSGAANCKEVNKRLWLDLIFNEMRKRDMPYSDFWDTLTVEWKASRGAK